MNSASIKMPPARRNPRGAWARLAWKEFRQTLPLLWVFSGMLLILIVLQARMVEANHLSPQQWYLTSWAVLCLFALTVGVFLFSPEFEDNTIGMLQQLPVSSGFIVRGKLWIGLGALLCFIFIAVLAQVYQIFVLKTPLSFEAGISRQIGPADAGAMISIGILAPIECFVCGVMCSLYLRRAIFAALLACFVVVLSWVIPLIFASLFGVMLYFSFVCMKTALLTIFATTLYPLGKKWLGNAPQIGGGFGIPAPISSNSKQHFGVGDSIPAFYPATTATRPAGSRVFRSLAWQTYRQQRYLFAALLLATFIVTFVTLGQVQYFLKTNGGLPSILPSVISTAGIWLGLFSLLLGMASFSADNRNENYTFFQQHGDFPGKIWLVRLLPAIALTCVSCSIMVCFFLYIAGRGGEDLWHSSQMLAVTIKMMLVIFTGFAIGQYNSIFFKSIVYTIASNLLMVALFTVGASFVRMPQLHVGPAECLLYCAPIPVAMFLLTRLWAPNWIAGQNKTPRVLIPHAILACVIATTVVIFCVQHQIRWAN